MGKNANKKNSNNNKNSSDNKTKIAEEATQALAAAASAAGSNAEFITSTTSVTTNKPPTSTSATSSASPTSSEKNNNKPDTIKIPKQSKLQTAVYVSLVVLSVSSLLWLVFVSMQPVSFAPCTLLNGTWFVSEEDSPLNPLLVGKFSASGLSSDNVLNIIPAITGVNIDSLVGQRQPSEYEIAEMEKINKNIVQVDLNEFVEVYGAANDSLRLPTEALPINLAPMYTDPLYINQLSVTYNGGAKVHWWTGPCKSVSMKNDNKRVASKCTLMILRGHWALSIFPMVGEELTEAVEKALHPQKKKNQIPSALSAIEPYTVVGTRLDSNEVAEEVVFNRKVKYVLALMALVGLIHYALSVVQPPNPKKLRRDVALGKLLEIEKRKLAQAQAEAAKAGGN